jgi:hypothetical protein
MDGWMDPERIEEVPATLCFAVARSEILKKDHHIVV